MYILYIYMYIPVLIFAKKKKKKKKKKKRPFSLSCVHKKMRDNLYLHFPCSLPRGLVSRQKRGGETVPSQGG